MIRGAERHTKARSPAWITARRRRHAASVSLGVALVCGAIQPAAAQESATSEASPSQVADRIHIPDISHWLPKATSRESLTSTLQIFVLLTVLTVLPSIVLMMTCFVRMLIVLVLLRQALGTQSLPPSQVLIGLALFMTLLVMAPTWERVREQAGDPYLQGELPQLEALSVAAGELRHFMFNQIEAAGNEQDVYLMYEYAAQRAVGDNERITRKEVPMTALIPAYLLSELKAAFVLGFRIYLPFLVIDMVIATVLVSMGMMMLPPVLISLPFKLLLFV